MKKFNLLIVPRMDELFLDYKTVAEIDELLSLCFFRDRDNLSDSDWYKLIFIEIAKMNIKIHAREIDSMQIIYFPTKKVQEDCCIRSVCCDLKPWEMVLWGCYHLDDHNGLVILLNVNEEEFVGDQEQLYLLSGWCRRVCRILGAKKVYMDAALLLEKKQAVALTDAICPNKYINESDGHFCDVEFKDVMDGPSPSKFTFFPRRHSHDALAKL